MAWTSIVTATRTLLLPLRKTSSIGWSTRRSTLGLARTGGTTGRSIIVPIRAANQSVDTSSWAWRRAKHLAATFRRGQRVNSACSSATSNVERGKAKAVLMTALGLRANGIEMLDTDGDGRRAEP